MKNFFLLLFIIILAAVGIVLAQEHSNIDLTYGEWTITVQTWLLLLAIIIVTIVYKLIANLICWFVNMPNRWSQYRHQQHETRDQSHQQAYKTALNELQQAKDLAELNIKWNQVPHRLQQNPELAKIYVRKAMQYNGEVAAASVMEWQLAHQWQPELVNYYGLLKHNAEARLNEVEHWLKQYPQDSVLLLAAARLCMNTEQWGKAENYLEESLRQKPSVAAHLELAQVEQQLGNPEISLRHYQMARTLQREFN